jgi:type II secretory pathway pseudopilin PulG
MSRINFSLGFTLLEMAILLLVIGLILSGLLPTLSIVVENRKRAQAMNELKEIREALLGFAVIHKRLPCPAMSFSAGRELPNSPDDVDCNRSVGYLPASTLGLVNVNVAIGNVINFWDAPNRFSPQGLMLDPWGQPYLYGVYQNHPACNRLTKPNAFTINQPIFSGDDCQTLKETTKTNCEHPGLKIFQCTTCENNSAHFLLNEQFYLTKEAVAVVFSQGKFIVNTQTKINYPLEWANLSREITAEFSDLPLCRERDVFISSPYNHVNSTYRFDDLMVWISPTVLHQRLLNSY